MRIYNVSRDEIIEAAQGVCKVEVEYQNPSRGGKGTFKVRCLPLKPAKDPHLFQRRNVKDTRWVNALCWHGFEAFFKALFEINPQCRAVTALATYDGVDGFYATYPATGRTNIGSEFYPCRADEACEC